MKLGRILSAFSMASMVQYGIADDAIADENSAVAKLGAENFKEFIDTNSLVLAEFFAPWCGHCKRLGPEFAKAADSLNESHPNIKLAQIDCTEQSDLCSNYGIRGYPTLKVIRGSENDPEDYEGSREANGIVDYMVKQSLPAVQVPETVEQLKKLLDEQDKPYALQLLSNADEAINTTFTSVANSLRKDLNFITVTSKELIESLSEKFFDFEPSKHLDSASHFIVHPFDNSLISHVKDEFSVESLLNFIKTEIVPYFGDINRETYLMYMNSDAPLGYFFYKTDEQRQSVEDLFNKLGKKFRGKINFVGLDANLFGKHAELLNMDPEIVPLFAIQDITNNKRFGIDQSKYPEGPSVDAIEEFVEDYFNDKLKPIIKSEPLPTEEEKASESAIKLVSHNYDEILKDTSKDIFVKYYAHWCGHCKRMAPTWDELADLYDSKNPDSQVVIAKIDHSKNDVDTLVPIEGYPTLLLYPANGEIDEASGMRKPISFEGPRDLDGFIAFVKENGAHGVDGQALKESAEAVVGDDEGQAGADHDEL